MSDEKTDNTDEPSKAELHDRVRKLESTVEKLMPSRRDALRMGAAGLAGAAGLSATTQPADASTGSAGQIGDSVNRPTIFADDIDANSLTGGVKNQGCRVFLSSDQSIAREATAKIQFDSQVYDSDNNFDISTHNWTCPQDGLYIVNAQVNFQSGQNGDIREIRIGDASSSVVNNRGAFVRESSTGSSYRQSVTTVNKYNTGGTIAIYVENNGSSDTLTGGSGGDDTFLEVAFLGGL